MKRSHNIGFIQGRLSPIINNKIQVFPVENWEKEFSEAKIIGLDMIEWTIDEETFVDNPLMYSEGRKKIKEVSKINNIKIPSLTCDYVMQKPFWKMNESESVKAKENFINIVNACYDLNIEIIVVPIVDNGRLENTNHKDNIINFFNRFREKLEKLNCKIAFESDMKPSELLKFIKNFDANFGVNYDTGNSASLGYDPSEEISVYGHRIINVHIKDRKLGGSTVPLGSGNCSFDNVFRNLNMASYNKNYILQTARDFDGNHSKVLKEYKDMTTEWIEKYG
tara:strand:- start:16 stop:855 length:840 start_codon:yes stop_codon:yes gene_type:complete